MKILLLASRFPYPPHRGDKLKIFNLIKQLSRHHEVTLLSFISSNRELGFVPELRKYCAEVATVHLPAWRSILNCIAGMGSRKPFQVEYYSSRRMRSALERTIADGGFDVMHVHLIRMAQYALDGSSRIPRVLDLTDAGSLYLQRFLDLTGNYLHRIFLREELARLRRYEGVLSRFDLSLVCSDLDKNVLLKNAPDARIELLYNGIDLEYFDAAPRRNGDPGRIIFTGNMSYHPNADAAVTLAVKILPLIKEQIPEATLYIVGKDPPGKVRRLSRSDVFVTGFVPEIKEYYLQSTVAVAPVRFGAGTLNKVLEPMALGIPVVASPVSVEGLPVADGRELLIADSPADFAKAVVRLLNDAGLQARLSEAGRTLVRRMYDWRTIANNLEGYYATIVRGNEVA